MNGTTRQRRFRPQALDTGVLAARPHARAMHLLRNYRNAVQKLRRFRTQS